MLVACFLAFSTPARAEVRVSPSVIDFGTVAVGAASAPVSVTLTNTGSRRARFSSVSVSGAPFTYSGPTGTFSVQAHQSLKVTLSFHPNLAQFFTGALTFTRSFGGTITVSLSGTGQGTGAQAPSFTSQPASRTVTAGQTASFSVSVAGTSPFTYQWMKNGAAIGGATSANYTTPATLTSDNGAQFAVAVGNSAGSVTSAAATLTVNPAMIAPTITSQPASSTVTAGQTASFAVVASGSGALSYQWLRNGAAIGGAISASYTTAAATMSDNGAQFTCSVGNSAGNVTSAAAMLTVTAATIAPTITSQPASRTVTAGQTASFTVGVSGTAPFTYQWMKNGAAIGGAISSSYTTPAEQTSDNGAQFSVAVSNSAGNVTSAAATLTVNAATLLLSVNPASLSFGNVNLGSSAAKQATLTNAGTGTVTLSGLSFSGAGFSASGVSTGQVLAPGQTASLNITFQPASAGNVTGSVTVASNASAPAVVTLSGSGVQLVTHTVGLSWIQSTSTVAGYYVYNSQVSGGPYTKLTSSAVAQPSYSDTSVQSGKTYYYVVTAVDSGGMESPYSNQATAAIP
jgi:beta-galactosidase